MAQVTGHLLILLRPVLGIFISLLKHTLFFPARHSGQLSPGTFVARRRVSVLASMWGHLLFSFVECNWAEESYQISAGNEAACQ